jgi:hypothetical protein
MRQKLLLACLALFHTFRFDDFSFPERGQRDPSPYPRRYDTATASVCMFTNSFCCREARRSTPIITSRKRCPE